MTRDVIGWAGLGVSLAFLGFTLLITGRQRLELNRSIVVAVARSLAQMAVVGAALVPLVDPDTPLAWSWAWVVAIVVFASLTTARRAPKVDGLVWVALAANVAVAASGLAIMFGLGVFELSGRTLVPVAGMIVGNSMKAAIVGTNRMAESVADHRDEIEAGIALGMSTRQASARLVRTSLRTAISPQVEQTAALGIVFLPGAMTGLILGGAEPIDAVRTQLALMYVILSGVVIAATTAGLGTLRRLSTSDDRLVVVARSR